jgi:ATP-dependent exoDNAse (exonuclease V) beta subunit
MSKLFVYKASAGSGKTFRLAAEYIKQLITDPESYKRILAVTFTNKATAEMKGRILDELFLMANGNSTVMGNSISEELGVNTQTLQKNAKTALTLILHDYSRFSISTIDSFVQRVIQSLLWEIGQQGGVDIEIDAMPVLEHASDNLIDSSSKTKELMKWLTAMGESLLDDGKSWDVRRALINLGKEIFSEKFRLMSPEDMERFGDKDLVQKLKTELENISKTFIKALNTSASKSLEMLEKRGIDQTQFSHGNSGVMGFFNKCASFNETSKTIPEYNGARVQKALGDPTGEGWVNKDVFKSADFLLISNAINEFLYPSLSKLIATIETNKLQYNSARLILQNLENLPLIGDLWKKVRELSHEEGFLLLSDSNHLLKEFVKDSDAPFVYEKIGTRYNTFMIDEFQDTSEVQWHNFKPLISNSLAEDSFSMIVGDVKQSIYRWRNGDWSILATGVEEDFKYHGIDKHSLEINYRSLPSIVQFNNAFFEESIKLVSSNIEEKLNDPRTLGFKELIAKAYEDVKQKAKTSSSQNAGYVECTIVKKDKDLSFDSYLSSQIPELIDKIRQNHKLGDIAILVRTQLEGQKIANFFIDYNRNEPNREKHITFVSQDGLILNSSSVVRLVIAAFEVVQDSTNKIAYRVLGKELAAINEPGEKNWHSYFDESFTYKEVEWLSNLSTRPIQEVFEAVAERYKLQNVTGELPYLAELHEHVISHSRKGSGDINKFLRWWEEKSGRLSLTVPESTNAISIITIHKSKGLQFPVVLIPYASWDFKPSSSNSFLWVKSDEEPFNLLPKYPIAATNVTGESLFAFDYYEEKMKEIVDNLNLLYVAFTRAEKELYIFSLVGSSETSSFSNTSKIISPVLRQISSSIESVQASTTEQFIFGEKSSSTSSDTEEKSNSKGWKMDQYPVGNNFRSIKLKIESEDFYQTEPSERKSILEHGVLMHNLFANIDTINDIDNAVNKMVNDGLIDHSKVEEIRFEINNILKIEPALNWFSGDWTLRKEATILTPDGNNYRPDRVMIKDGKAIIVDFKFGQELPSHKKQLKNYMQLLSDMGYIKTEGYIWYVSENRSIQVHSN